MNTPVQYFLFTLAFFTVWRPSVVVAGDATETGFVNKVFRQAGHESKYVVFVPHGYDGSKPCPTILFLHGLSQSGNDGLAQAGRGLATAIRKRERTFPFIVVFPHSHERSWIADSPDAIAFCSARGLQPAKPMIRAASMNRFTNDLLAIVLVPFA